MGNKQTVEGKYVGQPNHKDCAHSAKKTQQTSAHAAR